MLYLTAISNKKWPVTTSENGKDVADTEVHAWETTQATPPVVTTLPIVPGDLGIPSNASHWAIGYDNIVCLPDAAFSKIMSRVDTENSEILRTIVRKIGIGHWPIILVNEEDKKLERIMLIERIHVIPIDTFPHSKYEYSLFVEEAVFVNNASMKVHVPYDLVWQGDRSDISQICNMLYRDLDYRRHEFTDEEIDKIKIDLEAMGLKFDVAFFDGNHHAIRFYTSNLDGYQSWYRNRLDPTGMLYDIDISRQIKNAEGTYGIIRKREIRHHGECNPCSKPNGQPPDDRKLDTGTFHYDCSNDIFR